MLTLRTKMILQFLDLDELNFVLNNILLTIQHSLNNVVLTMDSSIGSYV